MAESPVVLMVAVEYAWMGQARVPAAFAAAGWGVFIAAPKNSYLAATAHRRGYFDFPGRPTPEVFAERLGMIAAQVKPDLIMPADDLTVAMAARLLDAAPGAPLGVLLAASLVRPGEAMHPAVRGLRGAFAQLCDDTGVAQPAWVCAPTAEAVLAFAVPGQAVVMKADGTAAGSGVRVCRSRAQIPKVHADLAAKGPVIAQGFVEGMSAQCSFAAWRGTYLAGLTALKFKTHPGATGPTSIARFINHPAMEAACARLAQAMGLSGLGSVDFMVDGEGRAWAIELNPRPTPIVHLGARLGRDLAAALRNALAGKAGEQGPLRPDTIALYPRERMRDPASPWVGTPAEDIPWDDPPLMAMIAERTGVMADAERTP